MGPPIVVHPHLKLVRGKITTQKGDRSEQIPILGDTEVPATVPRQDFESEGTAVAATVPIPVSDFEANQTNPNWPVLLEDKIMNNSILI